MILVSVHAAAAATWCGWWTCGRTTGRRAGAHPRLPHGRRGHVAGRPRTRPPVTLDGSYAAVRASVERVRSAQVGVALASHDGVLALGCVWRFHVGDLREVLCVCVLPRGRARDPRRRRGRGVPGQAPQGRGPPGAALYDLKVMAERTNVGGAEPPLAAAGRDDDAFSRFVELVRERKNGVLWYYNAFLSGLGAADTRELMSYKKITAEWAERLRKMKDRLPIC
jgi:hypothetical protein